MERVLVDGFRYLVLLDRVPPDLDLYVLCMILKRAGFLPDFIQAEVWAQGQPIAYFYFRRHGGGFYVGPSRRYANGRWRVFGKRYFVRQGYITDGRTRCVM
jgi:hypothetical protein